jgi:hypothetical protein
MFWAGWVLTILLTLLLTMSGVMKVVQPEGFADGWAKTGLPAYAARPIGIVELACVAIFLIPPTSMLGAILLTGYLGGAVVVHVHGEDAVIAPIVIGMLVWLALFLRDSRIRRLIPLRFKPN